MKKDLWGNIFDPISLRYDVRKAMEEAFSKYLTPAMNVYDIGCGDKPFKAFLDERVSKYIGVDIEDGFYDASHIDLIGDAYNVPIEGSTADAVISNQLIEHLERPLDSLLENNRILKEEGILFLAFPFLYPIHAAPRDFQRYTEFSIREMLKQSGFEIVNFKKIGGFWYAMGVFFGIYVGMLNRGLLKKLKIYPVLNFIVKLFFLIPHALESLAFKIAGRNPDNFRSIWSCNYVIVAKKIAAIKTVS